MPDPILHSVPIAPNRLPALGHLVSIARGLLKFLLGLKQTGDIVRVDLGPMPIYFITSPKLHRQALTVHSGSLTRGRIYQRASTLFGDGLATSTGAHHLRQDVYYSRCSIGIALLLMRISWSIDR